MGYYTRVLSTQADCIPIAALARGLKEESCRAIIQTEDDPEGWGQAVLRQPGGPEIAALERNLVMGGSLGEEELEEGGCIFRWTSGTRSTAAPFWLEKFPQE